MAKCRAYVEIKGFIDIEVDDDEFENDDDLGDLLFDMAHDRTHELDILEFDMNEWKRLEDE